MEEMEQYPFKVEVLLKFGTDLTSMAKKWKLDTVRCREPQIERLAQVLVKRRKNNACLIGDPGVGKTAIVEGLASKISDHSAPEKLNEKKVFSIDMVRLIAGAPNRGELEERLVKLVDEVKQSKGSVILYIDKVHTLFGAGGGGQVVNAANILKPALARGEITCVGATTLDDYIKYIEKDSELKRKFQAIEVPEPSRDDAIEILRCLKKMYCCHHDVYYPDETLFTAVDLSMQYMSELRLPGKAIDLMDEAGARVQLQHGKQGPCHFSPDVTEEHIAQVVSTRTGIPVKKLCSEESVRLLEMEDTLKHSLIGQDEAVSSVSRTIRRARVGLRDPTKPIACFLFAGPNGAGKTELATLLATEYFGIKEAMVRLDMRDYTESGAVSQLFGSPPGYIGHEEGGQLTEAVHKRPHNVVLLDEIEKANSKVFDVLFQILDDGKLRDGKGRIVDFKNTIIILTSNIGGELKNDLCDLEMEIRSRVKESFRPEFLNRVDEIVVFTPLEMVHIREVLDTMLTEFYQRMEKKNKKVEVSNGLKDRLVFEVYNTNYGATPLKRVITRVLEDNLADKILNGLKGGGSVYLDVGSDGEVIQNFQVGSEGEVMQNDENDSGPNGRAKRVKQEYRRR